MVLFSGDSSPDGFRRSLQAVPPLKRQMRATGDVRIILFGAIGAAPRSATRPIATGAFSFPVFKTN